MYITHNPAPFLVLPCKTGCLTMPISNVTILLFMGLDTKECNFIVQTASKTDYEES
jgi:hypothetical protein